MSPAPSALPSPLIPTLSSHFWRLALCAALLALPVLQARAESEDRTSARCAVESVDPSAAALPGIVGVSFRPLERASGTAATTDAPGFEVALLDASGSPVRRYLGLGTLKGKTAQITTYRYVTGDAGALVRGAKNGRFFLEQGRTGWFTLREDGASRVEISFAGCRWSSPG